MNSQELEQSWNQICQKIALYPSVDVTVATAFFSRIHPMVMSDGFLLITADTRYIQKYVEKNYLSFILQALREIYGKDYRVQIEDDLNSEEEQDIASTALSFNPLVSTNTTLPTTIVSPVEIYSVSEQKNQSYIEEFSDEPISSNITSQPSIKTQDQIINQSFSSFEDQDNSLSSFVDISLQEETVINTYTFENFIVGDSNKMAYSMALAVAEEPGKAHLNPLFLYGKSGIGKTHLLRSIQNYITESAPMLKIIYADSAQFLNDYVEACIRSDKEKTSYGDFKRRYEDADVLLIDDVQYLQGKTETLEILFQLFNSLTAQGKQVVFSADRAPKNIDIDERYISRFSQGGTVDIQPPELETKLSIIKSLINDFMQSESVPDFQVSPEIQLYIAEISSSNIRELKGAITRVIYESFYTNQPITLEEVQKILQNHFSGGPSKRLTVEDIQREVENYYRVSHADLLSKKRARNISHARKVAVYLCKEVFDFSYRVLEKKFNREHTTLMYEVQNIETKINENRDLREQIETIKNNLKNL